MKEVEPIRDQEIIQDVLDYLRARNERDYVLFLFGIYTGLRISDILKYRVRDIKDKDYVYITEQKTNKEKKFPIHDELKKVLSKYIKGKKDYEYLFKSQKGINKPIRRETVYKILNDAADAFGLEHIGCHTMRKTFGYFLYEDTHDLALIKDIFNHSHVSITMRYIGINQDKKDTAIKRLSFVKKTKKRN